MAEINKLSVEKVLNKLRSADAEKSKDARRAEKMDALAEETERLRAATRRLKRQPAARPKRD